MGSLIFKDSLVETPVQNVCRCTLKLRVVVGWLKALEKRFVIRL